jgi:hypothetical protein
MVNQDIKCNLCGESCFLGSLWEGQFSFGGLLNAQVIGGYESTPGNGAGALDDMSRYGFSMCEFCLDWLFQQFKIPVAVDDPMNDYLMQEGETLDEAMTKRGVVQIMERPQPPPWKPAAQRVDEDEWRQSKEEFHQENNRRSLLRKNHG